MAEIVRLPAIVGSYRVTQTDTNITYCYDSRLDKKEIKSRFNSYEPEPPKEEKTTKFPSIECPYCKEMVPNNGGAQFAHLKKHVRDLENRKILTKIQAGNIRSTKLSPEMLELFKKSFNGEKK